MLERFVRTIKFAKQTLIVRTYSQVTTVLFQGKIILNKIRRKFREDYVHKLALNDPVKYTLTYRDITPSSYQTPLLPKVICKPPRNFLEYDEKTTIFQSKPFQIYIVRSKILRNISSKTSFKVKSRSEAISYLNNKLMKSYLMINDIEVTRLPKVTSSEQKNNQKNFCNASKGTIFGAKLFDCVTVFFE